jgi:diguanylate cyclase (GGDEF)-like protein
VSNSPRSNKSIREYGVIGLSLGATWAAAALLWALHPALSALALLPLAFVPGALRARALARLSHTDPETGLHNGRYFRLALARTLKRWRPSPRPTIVALAGLDDLRDIQEAYGQRAADAVLAGVGAALARSLPKSSVVARLSGETFAIILPYARAATAQVLLERARVAVEAEHFTVPTSVNALNTRLSFGLTIARPDQAFEEIIDNADTALYAARRAYAAVPADALFGVRAQ